MNGAVMRAGGTVNFGKNAAVLLAGIPGGFSTIEFNDTHTHAEVLAAFDRAIAVS